MPVAMKWVPGIDTPQGRWATLLKLNLVHEERSGAWAALRGVGEILSRVGCGHAAPQPTSLVGFSARFFKGPLAPRRDDLRRAVRFGLACPVPPGLRRMNARGDERFAALCTDDAVRERESDLLLIMEAFTPGQHATLRHAAEELGALPGVVVRAVERGEREEPPRGPEGFCDGVSNLQDLRACEPERYRRYVYAGADDAGSPAYAGGSYVVYRKYVEHLDRWSSDAFSIVDRDGRVHMGAAARNRAIGRSAESGCVIHHQTGEELPYGYDHGEGVHAFAESHVRHANPRGTARTQFGAPVTPRDVRILRRSYPFRDRDPATGGERRGLLFLCFQGDIQQRGFEFIHNQWIMAGGFLGCKDAFMDPAAGIVEPVDGCYYFVPPPGAYPGAVFLS